MIHAFLAVTPREGSELNKKIYRPFKNCKKNGVKRITEIKIGYDGIVIANSKKSKPIYLTIYQLFLEWAIKNKTDGIIVGATFPKIIGFCKEKTKNRLDIYSPGVGVQGGNASQARKLGSNYLIVGRTILNSKNPKKTAEKLASDSIL